MEYEDRRDADDAYHEMHNKRIGRDDVLKIEVCALESSLRVNPSNMYSSGLVRLPQPLGALTLVVTAIGVTALVGLDLLAAAVLPLLVVVLATTLQGKMIAVTVTGTGITSAVTPEIALVAQTLGMRSTPPE